MGKEGEGDTTQANLVTEFPIRCNYSTFKPFSPPGVGVWMVAGRCGVTRWINNHIPRRGMFVEVNSLVGVAISSSPLPVLFLFVMLVRFFRFYILGGVEPLTSPPLSVCMCVSPLSLPLSITPTLVPTPSAP